MLPEILTIAAILAHPAASSANTTPIPAPPATSPDETNVQMAEQAPKPVETIPAGARATLRRSWPERAINLDRYTHSFFADDETYVVVLTYKDKKPGLRGNDPPAPDYEIVIARKDNSLSRFSLAR